MEQSCLYLHIPFCQSKCYYCDFFSEVGSTQRSDFLRALEQELRTESIFLLPNSSFGTGQKNNSAENQKLKPSLRTIYFGGGTPSLLSEAEYIRIFDAIQQNYDLSRCEERTLEANPDDLTPEYIQALRRLPFNRISVGIQSFVDEELKAINRRHTSLAAAQAVRNCSESGFQNISIDLMYGLPGQTLESFAYSLEQALTLPVQHISSYALSWEEGSVLYAKMLKGELKQAPDEMLESCFFLLKDRLEKAGFVHYELSNFALPDYQSKHNSAYWDGTSYLGVGPSAHSYNGNVRRFNPLSVGAYVQGLRSGLLPRATEMLDADTCYNDFVMTRLRTAKGLDLNELKSTFGVEKLNYCMQNAKRSLNSGSLEQIGDVLRLTRSGLFISDAVLSDLMFVTDEM
jgi:oxygen-independent coproporphyrinogen III oxidase